MSPRRGANSGGSRLHRLLLLLAAPVVFVMMAPLYMRSERQAIAATGSLQPDATAVVFPPLLALTTVSVLSVVVETSIHSCGAVGSFAVLSTQLAIFCFFRASRTMVEPEARTKSVATRSLLPQANPAFLNAESDQRPYVPATKEFLTREKRHDNVAERDVSESQPLGHGRISVVLPCADEGDYTMKTVMSFCNRTPMDVLQEIIVVDDGSDQPLSVLLASVAGRCKVQVLSHKKTMGLMVAKRTGGDAAVGEFIGFFDCHVSPNQGWYSEVIALLQASPRRLVVPTITDLDLDTWEEKKNSAKVAKCYIDFNADFMWYDDSSDFIPIISGGLVAIGRQWWRDSGGFDPGMRGWGGENVDQSLRTWLCGGDIVRAKSSRVAHMWRVEADGRTTAHYHRIPGTDNNGRVAAAWFDDFKGKYREGKVLNQGPDVSSVLERKHTLGCKPFAYFIHRFRRVYTEGGVLPERCFHLKARGHCLAKVNSIFSLSSCDQPSSVFHFGNMSPEKGGKCCSGIRLWNSLECFDRFDETGPLPYFCDVTGQNMNQRWDVLSDGRIRQSGTSGGKCLGVTDTLGLRRVDCEQGQAERFEQADAFIPEETKLYAEAVNRFSLSDATPDS